jgi:hypothetical protein
LPHPLTGQVTSKCDAFKVRRFLPIDVPVSKHCTEIQVSENKVGMFLIYALLSHLGYHKTNAAYNPFGSGQRHRGALPSESPYFVVIVAVSGQIKTSGRFIFL